MKDLLGKINCSFITKQIDVFYIYNIYESFVYWDERLYVSLKWDSLCRRVTINMIDVTNTSAIFGWGTAHQFSSLSHSPKGPDRQRDWKMIERK